MNKCDLSELVGISGSVISKSLQMSAKNVQAILDEYPKRKLDSGPEVHRSDKPQIE